MQRDFFESVTVAELKTLRERRERVLQELQDVNKQILLRCQGENDVRIGDNVWLGRHSNGYVVLFTKDANGALNHISLLSVDKLSQAVRQLGQETHDAPQGISGSHGSQFTQPPW